MRSCGAHVALCECSFFPAARAAAKALPTHCCKVLRRASFPSLPSLTTTAVSLRLADALRRVNVLEHDLRIICGMEYYDEAATETETKITATQTQSKFNSKAKRNSYGIESKKRPQKKLLCDEWVMEETAKLELHKYCNWGLLTGVQISSSPFPDLNSNSNVQNLARKQERRRPRRLPKSNSQSRTH